MRVEVYLAFSLFEAESHLKFPMDSESSTTHTLNVFLVGSRRNGRPSMGRARRKTRREENSETKSGGQEMPAHLGIQGDPCAWSMKEEESEEIKTRGRKLSQIGEVCE